LVGHIVHLEGCTLENGSFVGNGAIVLHRVIVRSGALVGANAVVNNDVEVPSGAMALGIPAKIRPDSVRPGMIEDGVAAYVERARYFKQRLRRLD
jgi:carbonic anhydrase/acetyltransferase-like protein (isoleucine patch superfamily)